VSLMTVWNGFAQLKDALLYGFVEESQVAMLRPIPVSSALLAPVLKALVDAVLPAK